MKLCLFILTGLISLSAFAGNTNQQPLYKNIVTSINADLDADGLVDTAYLVHPQQGQYGDLDLWVKLSTESTYYKINNVAYDMTGGAAGQDTLLRLNSVGSLQVVAFNEAIGRNRWESTTTFAYRYGTLVLAGYTYTGRDTISLVSDSCDVNLLNRRGIANASIPGDSGRAEFEIAPSDVLSVEEASADQLYETYMNGYCMTFDYFEQE